MIKLENSFTVPASLDETWQALLDIERMAPCVPGASLETVHRDEFEGSFKVKLGVTAVTYRGKVNIAQRDAGSHRSEFSASGRETRGNGSAEAVIVVSLVRAGRDTEVSVLTSLDVTGTAARLGPDALAKVAIRLTGQFADRARQELATGPSGPEPTETEVSGAVPGGAVPGGAVPGGAVPGEARTGVATAEPGPVARSRTPAVNRVVIAAGVAGAVAIVIGVLRRGFKTGSQ